VPLENVTFHRTMSYLGLLMNLKREKKKVNVSFSISGVFLEQCEVFSPDLLGSFKQLSETGCVEFLDQPYYHSLVGLYPVRDEFIEQVRMHRQLMKDHFDYEPVSFENTELFTTTLSPRS